MPLPLLVKGLLVGGGAVGLWALFGGDDTGGGGRGPYTIEVVAPGSTTLPWSVVDDTLCLSFDAVGAADSRALLDDLWSRLYPGVPSPPIAGDHPSVGDAYKSLGGRVSEFVNRVNSGETVCEEPGGGAVVELDNIATLFTGKPGGFAAIKQGDNPTKLVAAAYGIPSGETGNIRKALACVATVGYNLMFTGVPRSGDDYGRGKTDGRWYDVNYAFLPRHADPRIVAASGEKMKRWVGWGSGSAVSGNPGKFFPLWIPPMLEVANTMVCTPSGTWNPDRNPPAAALAKLGWTLAEMETAWKASPNVGPDA